MGGTSLKGIRPHAIAAILAFVYRSAYDIWKERESEATYYDVLDGVFSPNQRRDELRLRIIIHQSHGSLTDAGIDQRDKTQPACSSFAFQLDVTTCQTGYYIAQGY
ncbi:hypothetical protein [Pantoea ananatis]|uniref:hypothetical protein n=1 Tax=Pantoea ananas TaxID=553 RepID=UPI003F67AC27